MPTTVVPQQAEFNQEDQDKVILKTAASEVFDIERHVIKCSSKFDKLTMEVNVQKEKHEVAHQRCFILTVHNLGFDNTQFEEFINSKQMSGIRLRTVWLHVNLPGQEAEAADLNLRKYPTLEELADELIGVLDYFKLTQVVLFGEGVGATICAHFAVQHSNRCHGLLLIEPIGSAAGVLESMRFKLNNLNFMNKKSHHIVERANSLNLSNSGDSQSLNENETFHLSPVDSTVNEKLKNKNIKNLSLFAEAFLNRTCLIDSVSNLSVDVLIATGKQSGSYNEAKRLFRSIQQINKKSPQKLVNTPFLELENTANILENSADQLAVSIQYFLQGIGLLSAMPLKMSLMKTRMGSVSSYGRSMSIDETSSEHTGTDVNSSPALSTSCLAE